MGRKKGPDKTKMKKIEEVLKKNPNGLWVREIARQAHMSKTTTHRYITKFMKNKTEEVVKIKNVPIKIIKLKGG